MLDLTYGGESHGVEYGTCEGHGVSRASSMIFMLHVVGASIKRISSFYPGWRKSLSRSDFAIVIPVYNHEQRVAEVIRQALELEMPLFVVDDGSTDRTAEIIDDISGITVLRHEINQGKGAALLTGFIAAGQRAKWAITIDADGQHKPADALNLIRVVSPGKRAIIVGKRQGMTRKNVPWTSRFGRQFSNFWVWVSGGPYLHDSQSGFRLYPLPESLNLGIRARRFQFEVEIIVKARQYNLPVLETPVQVVYQQGVDRISHFHPFKDFWRNFATFSRLITSRIFKGLFRRRK